MCVASHDAAYRNYAVGFLRRDIEVDFAMAVEDIALVSSDHTADAHDLRYCAADGCVDGCVGNFGRLNASCVVCAHTAEIRLFKTRKAVNLYRRFALDDFTAVGCNESADSHERFAVCRFGIVVAIHVFKFHGRSVLFKRGCGVARCAHTAESQRFAREIRINHDVALSYHAGVFDGTAAFDSCRDCSEIHCFHARFEPSCAVRRIFTDRKFASDTHVTILHSTAEHACNVTHIYDACIFAVRLIDHEFYVFKINVFDRTRNVSEHGSVSCRAERTV